MMTNLQNIKNTLKKTLSDQKILSFISEFDFIDDLIGQHLDSFERAEPLTQKSKTKFLPRNAQNYREFIKSLDNVKDRYDPYTNIFLKEAGHQEYTRKILPKKIRKARTQEKKEMYQEILDNLLLTEFAQTRSQLNVGTHVFKKYKINFNMETLIRDENNYNRDPEVYSSQISDELFLENKRVQSESNLIKTKIIHKLHLDLPLTKNEQKYLKLWNKEMQSSKLKNLSK